MAQRGGPVNPQFVSLDEYDCLVYPGFLRRTVRARRSHAATTAVVLAVRTPHAAPPSRSVTHLPHHCVLCCVLDLRRPSLCAPPEPSARPVTPPTRLSLLASLSLSWRPRLVHVSLTRPSLLRQMARWNEDGSCAATARMRNGKGEPFTLTLTKAEIDDDLARLNAADPARR